MSTILNGKPIAVSTVVWYRKKRKNMIFIWQICDKQFFRLIDKWFFWTKDKRMSNVWQCFDYSRKGKSIAYIQIRSKHESFDHVNHINERTKPKEYLLLTSLNTFFANLLKYLHWLTHLADHFHIQTQQSTELLYLESESTYWKFAKFSSSLKMEFRKDGIYW